MLQAVTWGDLHLDCWCYAGCISQMCDCVQLKQFKIHWCMSTSRPWLQVKKECHCQNVCVCAFGLHSTAYPTHFHSYLSSLCMASHECTHPALKSWQCVCWCQAPACFRDSILTFFLFLYPQEEQREAGILRRFWGFPLSFCVMRVAEISNKRPKEEEYNQVLWDNFIIMNYDLKIKWSHKSFYTVFLKAL